jgi:small subunit ribosomal protein S4
MGRYTGPICRICRREGEKLFLKGEKCYTDKCIFTKKGYPPGERKRAILRRKISDYGLRLREKQKAKRLYGIGEAQFRRYYEIASRKTGKTGEILLQLLERRLDNVVYSLGFATSRAMARQLVTHGHFLVNDKSVNMPSYLVKPGDVVKVCEKSRNLTVIHDSLKIRKGPVAPWLELDKAKLEGRILALPTKESIPVKINEQLIVEFYSR